MLHHFGTRVLEATFILLLVEFVIHQPGLGDIGVPLVALHSLIFVLLFTLQNHLLRFEMLVLTFLILLEAALLIVKVHLLSP